MLADFAFVHTHKKINLLKKKRIQEKAKGRTIPYFQEDDLLYRNKCAIDDERILRLPKKPNVFSLIYT